MKQFILFGILILNLWACQNDFDKSQASGDIDFREESLEMEEQFQAPPPPRTAEPPPPPISEESEEDQAIRKSVEKSSKIIKDGRVVVEVNDLEKAKAQVDSTLVAFNAYYENENYQAQTYRSTYHLMIRIPSENFEKLLAQVESGNGKVIEKNIAARDVTDEYVDVAIRLNNNRNYLNRYQALLKKANSIKDILAIQEKTRKIEEEIDSRTGRLKYIDDKVKFSTLRLELFQKLEVTRVKKARNFGAQFIAAISDGFDAFLDFLLFLVGIWPFVLILAGLWFFRRRIGWRFWRRKE